MAIHPNKKNFSVVKPFDWNGEHFEKGGEWKRPDDWRIDNEFTERYVMRSEGKDVTAVAFLYDKEVGYEEQKDNLGRARQVPVIQPTRVILPVE